MYLDSMNTPPDWLSNQASQCSSKANNTAIAVPSSMTSGMFAYGRRNQDFIKLAGLCRRNGMNEMQMREALSAFNSTLDNPLGQYELDGVINSSARWEASEIEAITHVSYSDLLLNELQDSFCYVLGDGFWSYNGLHWEVDQEQLLVLDEAVQLSGKMIAELPKIQEGMHSEDFKSLKKSVYKTQSAGFLKSSIELFKSKPSIKRKFESFNKQSEFLNLSNCVYNFNSGEALNHSSEHLFTWVLDVAYDHEASCPRFDDFMDEILTKPAQRLLMQLIACSIIGEAMNEQKFVFLTGYGQNGKGTLIKIMQEILGSLCAEADPSSFMRKTTTHIPNDLARLAGKRLVFTSETNSGDIIASDLMKRMTGGDKLLARFLHKEYFEFTAEFIPFIITNFLPVIDGSDFAMKRRVLIIPFDKIIPDNKRINGYEKILLEERNGIFNRILEAIEDYQKNGLVVPPEIQERINKYVDSSNLFKRFFDENLEKAEGHKITARDMFLRYQKWCENLNVKAMSEPQFKANFERSIGIIQDYNSRGNWWPNIRWAVHPAEDAESVGLLKIV